MMSLSEMLAHYAPFDEHEATMTEQLRAFLSEVAEHPGHDAFGRDLAGDKPNWGHVTGSAWVVNVDGTRVLMVHHAKLERWVQPGGHCDGEADVLNVARREAWEETGLDVTPLQEGLFDVDVHRIPEYWNTPDHFHYDVRFLLQANDSLVPHVTPESRAVRWVTLEEAAALNAGESITRMIEKTRRRFGR